ncbi:MAG: alcohol dehydrogenase catalytic domain-containing protein [bacterium]
MKAVVFKAPGNLVIEDRNIRALADDELLIEVGACGVCGTDVHIFRGEAAAKNNTIIGHEFSGLLVDVANKSFDFNIGDKVAVDPNIYCGYCSYCKVGKIQFCSNHTALGVTEDGGFAEYVIAPVSNTYKLPIDFSLSTAAFAEPLSCCIHGIDKAEIKVGENIIIIGGGAIGLMMLQLSLLNGAAKCVLIEPVEEKRNLAKTLGIDLAFSPNDENLEANINDVTRGHIDCIIECAGNPDAASLALKLAGKGSRIIFFGLHPAGSSMGVNLQEIFKKELSIKTSLLNPFTFSRAIEFLISKKINVELFDTTKMTLYELVKFFTEKHIHNSIKYQFNNLTGVAL